MDRYNYVNPNSSGMMPLFSTNYLYQGMYPQYQQIPQQKMTVSEHFAYQGAIYQLGGRNHRGNCVASVSKFLPSSGLWHEVPPMSTPRVDFAAASSREYIFVSGGENGSSESLGSAEVLNIRNNVWSALPNMNTRRSCVGCSVLNNVVYVSGGMYLGTWLNAFESFTPGNHYWQQLPNMHLQRSRCELLSANNALFAIGGSGHYKAGRTAEMYDPRSGKWFFIPEPGVDFQYCCATVFKHSIYVCGDLHFEEFDIVANRWRRLPNPGKCDYFMKMFTFCGEIYTMGGSRSMSTVEPVNTVECFNINEGTWVNARPLDEPIANHCNVVAYPDLAFH